MKGLQGRMDLKAVRLRLARVALSGFAWVRRVVPRVVLPRSLGMRMLLLVLGTVLVVQVTTLVSAERYRKSFTETFTVDVIATTIRTLRASLAEIPPNKRAEFVRNASRREWYLLSSLPAQIVAVQHDFHLLSEDEPQVDHSASQGLAKELWDFVKAINARLNKDARVVLSNEPVPTMFISLPLEPSPYRHNDGDSASADTPPGQEWLVIPLEDLTPPAVTPWIISELVIMALALIIAAIFAWHITRPLTHLTRAADRLASGQPHRVTPSGPQETRSLGQHFNHMLDALNEASMVRRTMLAGLPHDLKGPLSRMWLRLEMMEDSPFKEGLLHDAKDMQRMVNQFTGFVRGTDPGSYQFVQMNLGDWLAEQIQAWESTGDTVRYLDQSGQVKLTLRADPGALARLLDNLITNALKHGAAPVDVQLRVEDKHAVLVVSDHGKGIDPQRREEALRPFSRLDEARTKTGSVGLGLALCEAIVKAHQGKLVLGQAPSGGLAVAAWLPLLPVTGQATAGQAKSPPKNA